MPGNLERGRKRRLLGKMIDKIPRLRQILLGSLPRGERIWKQAQHRAHSQSDHCRFSPHGRPPPFTGPRDLRTFITEQYSRRFRVDGESRREFTDRIARVFPGKEVKRMSRSAARLLYWSPRILTIAFGIFISLFALEAFNQFHGFWRLAKI